MSDGIALDVDYEGCLAPFLVGLALAAAFLASAAWLLMAPSAPSLILFVSIIIAVVGVFRDS